MRLASLARRSTALLTVTLLLSACAQLYPAAATPAKAVDGVLVGATNQMTLYTFDRDAAGNGKSACYGPCAVNWPPLMAKADDKAGGDWSIINRDDGSKQWAFKGKPLYFWAKDSKPGDRSGDGVNKVWSLAKP